MIIKLNEQTVEEHKNEAVIAIHAESLEDIKGIIAKDSLSNDDKVHLIESRFIIEKAEMKELDEKIESLSELEAFLKKIFSESDERCADCNCERADVPEGQLTIFELLGAESGPWEPGVPFGEEETEEQPVSGKVVLEGLDDLPAGMVESLQELTGALQSVLGK